MKAAEKQCKQPIELPSSIDNFLFPYLDMVAYNLKDVKFLHLILIFVGKKVS